MSKVVKFNIPRGKNKASYSVKRMAHGAFRCKRKPNSKLCRNGSTK